MADKVGKYGISTDEELFYGEYDSREEAIDECEPGTSFIGQYREPADPASLFDGDDVIERIFDHEDYQIDVAEDALDATKEQRADLTAVLQGAFRDWMQRHKIKVGFLIVPCETQEKIVKDEDGHCVND